MTHLNALKQKSHAFHTEVYALYLAYRDNRIAWYVRALLAFGIGYALSPVDLVPDLTAVFGYLDDVVLVAVSVSLSYRLLARGVRQEARLQAHEEMSAVTATSAVALKVLSFAWLLLLTLVFVFSYKLRYLQMA
ncbi:DUF1232 domain-containing protein [Pontibacter sp. E15-1]|uniref:YkvA family protein n=1 Tax=Pontibacter sp. E15-1 TaxID=2919918 RepID=UPI001F501598|nr:DUF1232 domain-containing protein [Pontibacter sp. E15-1]MCJ8166991.1 DUF1232 domain-containing protein [Pontibacter sp. E15-1]